MMVYTRIVQIMMMLCLMVVLSACVSATTATKSVGSSDAKAAEINAKLGAHYLQRGELQAAKSKLDKAVEQNPRSSMAHNVLAALYLQLKQFKEAEMHFERAVSLAPENSEIQNNYGVFLCGQERYRESEKRFLMALEDPLYVEAAGAYENAGICVQRIPDIEKAVDYFTQALRLDPYMPKSLLQLGNINYDKGDAQHAQTYLERYKKIARHGPQSLYLSIRIAHKQGDKDALASYRLQLRSKFPDSDEAKQVRQGDYK